MTDLAAIKAELRTLSEDATPGPWTVGPEGFGIVPAGAQESTRLGADSRYIVALVNWHRALLADTPSVEPAGMAEPAHIVSAFRQSERENAESVDVERFIEAVRRSALLGRREPTVMLRMWVKYAEVIQRHYALLPTQASDSPEKP